MRRSLLVLMLGMVLAGCGGRPEAPPEGFVNQTHHSDPDLWTIWKAAQETLAEEIDLNPLQRSFAGAPADIRPGDRACAEGRASPTPRGLTGRHRLQRVAGRHRHGAGQSDRHDCLSSTL